jgi:hypothetical protein
LEFGSWNFSWKDFTSKGKETLLCSYGTRTSTVPSAIVPSLLRTRVAAAAPFFSKIPSEQRSDCSDEDSWRLIVVLAVVDLGEMPNPNPLLRSKFHGSNHLVENGLAGVIPEIHLAHVLDFCQTEQFLFIAILGHLYGINKFYHCGQSCRVLRHLFFDTKITLVASVFWKI